MYAATRSYLGTQLCAPAYDLIGRARRQKDIDM